MKAGWLAAPVAAVFYLCAAGASAAPADTGKPKLGLGLRNAVLVHKVLPDGNAAKAGFKVGDAILAVNGQAVADTQAAAAAIEAAPAGEMVFKVVRSGREMTITTGQRGVQKTAPGSGKAGRANSLGAVDQ